LNYDNAAYIWAPVVPSYIDGIEFDPCMKGKLKFRKKTAFIEFLYLLFSMNIGAQPSV
jgi:hypothetical protein